MYGPLCVYMFYHYGKVGKFQENNFIYIKGGLSKKERVEIKSWVMLIFKLTLKVWDRVESSIQ